MLSRTFFPRWGWSILVGGLIVLLNQNLNLAGEWFVGGVEAKCYAYGCAFIALAMAWRQNYPAAWFWGGLACGFHILVGLWMMIAWTLASLLERVFWRRQKVRITRPAVRGWQASPRCLAGLVSVGLFLVGFWPAWVQNRGVSQDLILQANEAQSMWRLAHHQLATSFDRWILFCPMVAAWLVLVRANQSSAERNLLRLNLLVLAALVISWCGLMLSLGATWLVDGWGRDMCVRLLTLYWFRLADVLVPLACVINALWLATRLPAKLVPRSWVVTVLLVSIVLGIAANFYANLRDPRSGSATQAVSLPVDPALAKREIEADRNWIRTCHWIRGGTPQDSVFITPFFQQTFKWYAHRAEVASRKDMPQDAPTIVLWMQRLSVLYSLQPDWTPSEQDIVAELHVMLLTGDLPFDANYIVIEQRWLDVVQDSGGLSDRLQQVYPEAGQRKSTFAVFRRR